MSRGDISIFFGMMVAGGLSAYWYGLKQYALKNAIKYTATSKAVSVAPGLTEVSGIARTYKEPHASPFENKECAYYWTELYKWSGSGKSRHRSLVKTFFSTDPIYVEDDTGMVLVRPTLKPASPFTSVGLEEDKDGEKTLGTGIIGSIFREKPDITSRMYKFVSKYEPSLKDYGDKLEVHETYIRDGDKVYVLGTAKLFEGKGKDQEMLIWDDPKGKYYCIADGKEEDTLENVEYYSTVYSFGGPFLALIGYLLLLVRFNTYSDELVGIGVGGAALLYVWLAATILVAMYNGLFQLRNNILKAGANIDVLLKKRYDLIPALAEVVRSYTRYEKELQETIAGLRGLPVGAANKSLIAAIERYPELKANGNFMMLQKQMTKVEDQIAASRAFYNDSAKLYNSQIESFPYILFAPRMGMTRMEYLKFDK